LARTTSKKIQLDFVFILFLYLSLFQTMTPSRSCPKKTALNVTRIVSSLREKLENRPAAEGPIGERGTDNSHHAEGKGRRNRHGASFSASSQSIGRDQNQRCLA
jgi:hypothetical protein